MKFALITGGSRGIGKAIAIELAKDNYNVLINYRSDSISAKKIKKEIEQIGVKAYLLKGDVSNELQMRKVFKKVGNITQHIDLLVNNAGIDDGRNLEELEFKAIKNIINVNLIGSILVTKLALPFLKNASDAQILNISSRMGKEKVIEGVSAYAPSKAGLIKFTQCCALEFAKYNIRSNAICPGFTDTDLNRKIVTDKSFWKNQALNNPSRRVGLPEDVANVVTFLASPRASYINGEALGVNGGSVLV
jgi:3-oxoacyl-[acyl-carrier protein] reductase